MRGDPTAVTRHLGQPVQIIAALGSFVGNKITIGPGCLICSGRDMTGDHFSVWCYVFHFLSLSLVLCPSLARFSAKPDLVGIQP